jgi:hypothetical protein
MKLFSVLLTLRQDKASVFVPDKSDQVSQMFASNAGAYPTYGDSFRPTRKNALGTNTLAF